MAKVTLLKGIDMKLDTLEALAKAATPGPWKFMDDAYEEMTK